MIEIYDFLRRLDGNTFFLLNDLTRDVFLFKALVFFVPGVEEKKCSNSLSSRFKQSKKSVNRQRPKT